MRKAIRISIWVVIILLMLSVWPLCFVRKTAEVSSNMATTYGVTEQYICHDVPFIQFFEAQTSKLMYFDFKLSCEQDVSSLDGKFYITLLDEQEHIISEKEIGFGDIESYFWHVDINEWIKKGEVYKISITVDKECDNIFKGFYTTKQDDNAPGSILLCMGEEIVDGQGLARYGYGYPLNIKNIVCIWAFLMTIGVSIYLCCGTEQKVKMPEMLVKVWDKVWMLLRKYQVPILVVEMFGLLVLMAYLCRNRAVNWDESYSYMMITRLSLVDMIHATALDMHPPLYYLLLRGFCTIFGSDIMISKLMSVMVSGCTMVLGITLIRKNWGAKVAFLFNLVIGLGPQFITNAINVRMYALAMFFVTWSALLAYDIIRENKRIKWVLFVIASLGGVYTHYFTVVPLVLIYGYLLIGLFLERKQDCKKFVLGCVATVVGYVPWLVIWFTDSAKGIDEVMGHLPWLAVVLHTFEKESTGAGINLSKINFYELFEWMYSTNIKSSVLMGVVLVVVSIVMLIWKAKNHTRKNRMFLILCATNLLISYVIIALIASSNTHFFDNRYIYATLGLFWLFVIIMFSQKGKLVFCLLTVNLMISVLSAYTIQNSVEVETGIYVDNSYSVLEQVKEEDIILYNFSTFHILYGAHLLEQEFVAQEEMDWEAWDKDYIYLISWGGSMIPTEIMEQYNLQYSDCGTLNLELGYTDARLYKIYIGK
uniref:glycosyltransferase family 39 protein n=1 Tax=Acetatifactor sp. TaxID=1872090 RepID=UPI0040567B40